MAKIALKPKYPTRGAIDKVLFNEELFLDIVDLVNVDQIKELFATSFVAIVSDGKYYPVTIDNVAEQLALDTPTVDEDESFGKKKLEHFFSAVDESDGSLAMVQEGIQVYNGIIKGSLYRVADYKTLGIEKITKPGWWIAVNFDKTGAESEGYSEVEFGKQEADNGINYRYLGDCATVTNSDGESSKFAYIDDTILTAKAKFTVEEKSTNIVFAMYSQLKALEPLSPTEYVDPITMNGAAYDTLKAAFDAVPAGKVGNIVVSKSITETTPIVVEEDKIINLVLNNNVTISTPAKGITMMAGVLYVSGKGTIKETTPSYSPIMMQNTNQDGGASVYISEGITLIGWAGLFLNKASYNLSVDCAGKLIGCNDGSDNGAGLYVNGTVKSSFIKFHGSTEGTVGTGIFASGNVNMSVYDAYIEGSDIGFEIRSGSLEMYDSTIKSLSENSPSMTPSGSGTTADAVGFAIAPHISKNPVSVVTNRCTFVGGAALMEGDPNTTGVEVELRVNGGVFSGREACIKTLTPETDCKKFLYGGIFNKEVEEDYIADGFVLKERTAKTFEIVPEE